MANIKYEAIAKAGSYKNKDGQDKTRYHKCGVVFESDKGLSLKLESLPIPFDGWLSLRPPLPKERAAPAAAPAAPFADDDVPFN